MKKGICVFCHQLLKTHVVLILISTVRTVPIANSSALNYGPLTNASDSAKEAEHELQCNNEATDVAKEALQVLDQLIIEDAELRLSSGTNFTEMSPTTDDLVPSQLMPEEMTQVKKELDTISDTVDAEIFQVQFASFSETSVVRILGVRYCLRGGAGRGCSLYWPAASENWFIHDNLLKKKKP
jgi:hypothetical protein